MAEDRKFIIYGVAGVSAICAVLGAAYFLSRDGELGGDLSKIGKIRWEQVGGQQIIEFSQVLDITKLIHSSHQKAVVKTSDKYKTQRHKAYSEQDWATYEKVVLEHKKVDDEQLQKIVKSITEGLGITEAIFDKSIEFYQQDSSSLQALLNVRQQATLEDSQDKPAITREKTHQCFVDFKNEETELIC